MDLDGIDAAFLYPARDCRRRCQPAFAAACRATTAGSPTTKPYPGACSALRCCHAIDRRRSARNTVCAKELGFRCGFIRQSVQWPRPRV
jgi:hypothetical protein